MAKFNDAYLTDAGADLIAQSITDGIKIDFIRMEIGDGEYAEEEKGKDVLRKRTNLKNKRQESSFNSVEKAKDSAVKLKAAIDNRNVTKGYRMTEIGIYAKASGDTASDGVLYSIAVAVEPDYMPPESTPITYIQEFYTKVGNAENVEITVSTGVYALAEDLAEVEEPTYTESEELEELTPGEDLKLALGKIAKAVKEIIAHMALKATGSILGHVKVSSSSAVTDSTGMALAATEKNATIEGTLANQIAELNTNLTVEQIAIDQPTNTCKIVHNTSCKSGQLVSLNINIVNHDDMATTDEYIILFNVPVKYPPRAKTFLNVSVAAAGTTELAYVDTDSNVRMKVLTAIHKNVGIVITGTYFIK